MDWTTFNGAALFQVRIIPLESVVKIEDADLQWGRTFSSADNDTVSVQMFRTGTAFNGAALFQVRIIYFNALVSHVHHPSMGPHFFKCG